jgi:hypothetical protein
MAMRDDADHPLSGGSTPAQSRHVGGDPGFIDKYQV